MTRGRAGTRSARQAALMRAAASVTMPPSMDVCIVGGGAAGLAAAICAAEAGAHVVVLESALECGRTILATGNGRCNFANERLDPARYNDPAFVGATMGACPLDDILSFLRDSRLRWCVEEGRLYPLSRRAASVRNVLLARAVHAGATLAPARTVRGMGRTDTGFELDICQGFASGEVTRLNTGRVVLALGGGAEATATIAARLGLALVPGHPVLCPVATGPSPLLACDGRRVLARVSLVPQGADAPLWHEQGEVLIRGYGLSGIVVFDLSRRCRPGDVVRLDLAPEVSHQELARLADPTGRGTFVPGCLDGVLDPDIATVLEREARGSSRSLVGLVKGQRLVVRGRADESHAQVMAGGLATTQFSPTTLEAREVPGLFACGEVLDVDGDCGGFNLAWAWRSGMVAGMAAAGGISHA